MIFLNHLRKSHHSAIIFLYIYLYMPDKSSLAFHVFKIQKSSLNTVDRHRACMRDQTHAKSLYCCPRSCQSLFYNICNPLDLGLSYISISSHRCMWRNATGICNWQRIGHRELKNVQTEKNRVRTVYHIVSSWWKARSCPKSSVSPVKCRHKTKHNEKNNKN